VGPSCQDFDGDLVFSGDNCEAELIDCNDFDPAVFPGNSETCDGKDNDCNDLVDLEDDNYVPEACSLTEGVCSGTVKDCSDGILVACIGESYGVDYEIDAELSCDGIDNDCDGLVDEDISRTCYSYGNGLLDETLVVITAVCQTGLDYCLTDGSGQFSEICDGEITPVNEDVDVEGSFELRCDGLDNDCDGVIDEACNCSPGETRPCYSFGLGVDDPTALNAPCRLGFQACGDDALFETTCQDEFLPSDETCFNPGIDDDCDSDVTESDIPGFADSCTLDSLSGACRNGTMLCVEDEETVQCVGTLSPVAENCENNGVDDDCDGFIDNIIGLSENCIVTEYTGVRIYGECQYGRYDCDEDDLTCIPGPTGAEVCNGLDDDCDGLDDTSDPDIDTSSDPLNCGFCDNACDFLNSSCCTGECTNTQNNILNCGGCDISCESGLDPECCDIGDTGLCVDLAFEDDHCGECDEECPHPGDSIGKTTCCDSGCIDTQTDVENCGSCGHTCAADEQCCAGSCQATDSNDFCGDCSTDCNDDSEVCCEDGGGFACFALVQDGFCGGCGVTCDGIDPSCCDIEGTGVGTCVDLATDMDHCVFCNLSCEAGTSPACCEVGGTGACIDTAEDDDHCGGCDISCTSITATKPNCCDSTCTDLETDPLNCGECGDTCDGGSSSACCEGDCTDLTDDASHCGGCGITCNGGETCCNGYCVNVLSLFEPLIEDNCGTCGSSCDFDAGERCCSAGAAGLSCQIVDEEGDCP
jgi:hypothetical protein